MLDNKELIFDIRKAENFHGHLGPFLVIGVKMARLAKKALSIEQAKLLDMQIFAKLPLITPFSCVLDGIQATTQCTVGNRKLKVKSSGSDITATFKLKGQGKVVKIRVKPQLVEELRKQLSKGTPNEKLAWIIADTPEDKLFEFKIDKASFLNNFYIDAHQRGPRNSKGYITQEKLDTSDSKRI